MKKIATSLLVSLTLAVGGLFQSCSDNDGFSVGDIAMDWATVHAKSVHSYSLTGDTWGTMWPSASSVLYTPVDGERVMTLFNPLYKDYEGYDYAIKVEGIQRILTKQIEELTPENDAEFGNDPVNIVKGDMWVSGGYLNVIFNQNLPAKVKHRVSLVKPAVDPLIDEEGYLHVAYRYNTYDDVTGYWGRGAVSFSLQSLQLTPEVKGLKVTINSAVNGEQVIVFDLKAADGEAPSSLSSLRYTEMEVQ